MTYQDKLRRGVESFPLSEFPIVCWVCKGLFKWTERVVVTEDGKKFHVDCLSSKRKAPK